MIYVIFDNYCDIVGYFDNRLDTDKYCAAFGNSKYLVKGIKNLKNKEDLSKVILKYEHEVVFDFKNDEWIIRDEPDRYKCYIADDLKPNRVNYLGYQWVSFFVNINENNRKLAEEKAQDYLHQLLSYGNNKIVYERYVNLMNKQFYYSFKRKEEIKKQRELREKELVELARLKEKYES